MTLKQGRSQRDSVENAPSNPLGLNTIVAQPTSNTVSQISVPDQTEGSFTGYDYDFERMKIFPEVKVSNRAKDSSISEHPSKTPPNINTKPEVQSELVNNQSQSNLHQRVTQQLGRGETLESSTRSLLESRFDQRFDQVRIHNDTNADQLSHELSARAFTTGQDIFFRSGQYEPNSTAGQHLLAHELTHVVQQSQGQVEGRPISFGVQLSQPNDAFEIAAERTADTIVSSNEHAAPRGAALNPLGVAKPASEAVMVQRDAQGDGSIVFPEDKIKGNEVDEETRVVMQNIAAARTRAIAYLEVSKTEIMMAVDTFKGHANGQIDAMDLDPSASLDLVDMLVGAIGGLISGAFPPVAAAVIITSLAVTSGKSLVITEKKATAANLKQNLKQSVFGLGETIKNAQSAGILKVNEKLSTQLNELAATDKGVWDLLKIGNDRQLDDVIARLGIRDPNKNSPFGNVLKAMLATFGRWMAKANYQYDMKGSDKLISEKVPQSELFKGLRSAQNASENVELERAQEMIKQHEKGSTP